MPAFVPGLPARDVADHLRDSLAELDRARETVALWFADMMERRLWRDLGHSSIYQFAELDLGFSRRRTSAFIRIARSMQTLPRLRQAVASGEVEWSKADVVARVATPETEREWVEEARTNGRRALEARARDAVRVAKSAAGGNLSLVPAGAGTEPDTGATPGLPPDEGGAPGRGATGGPDPGPDARGVPGESAAPPPPPAAVTVSLRFAPDQLARFEALRERLARRGRAVSPEEAVLLGLEAVVAAGPAEGAGPDGPAVGAGSGGVAGSSADPAAVSSAGSPVGSAAVTRIVVRECPACGKADVPTGRGDLPLDAVTLERLRCEAIREVPGERNRRPVPESRRREALRRDGHRCRGAGCGHRHFLEVHHRVPRVRGGTNRLENLITLCSGCHAALHRHPGTPLRNAQPVAHGVPAAAAAAPRNNAAPRPGAAGAAPTATASPDR